MSQYKPLGTDPAVYARQSRRFDKALAWCDCDQVVNRSVGLPHPRHPTLQLRRLHTSTRAFLAPSISLHGLRVDAPASSLIDSQVRTNTSMDELRRRGKRSAVRCQTRPWNRSTAQRPSTPLGVRPHSSSRILRLARWHKSNHRVAQNRSYLFRLNYFFDSIDGGV